MSEESIRRAARLIAKALQVRTVPGNDREYRELLAYYEAHAEFRVLVDDIAGGLTLRVLESGPRGLVLVPVDAESRFAFRLGDLRQGLEAEDKALLVLIHTAIASYFYPTGESLDDELYNAPAITERQALTALKTLCLHLKGRGDAQAQGLPREVELGWESVLLKPEAFPEQQRRRTSSLEGLVSLVFRQLVDAGLVRRESDEGVNSRYTANWRMTVHLRESTTKLFEAARGALGPAALAPDYSTVAIADEAYGGTDVKDQSDRNAAGAPGLTQEATNA